MTRRDLLWHAALGHAACLTALAQTDPRTGSMTGPTNAATPAPDADPLHQLRPAHPRLILLDADFDRVRLLVRENALAKRIYGDLEKECDRLLSIPPIEYRFTGPRLQIRTRRAIDRITSLALMYRLSGRDPWLRRAMMEMNAGAAFRDWNPSRPIDTAEMTFAFAIGYDWLYNALTPEERVTVRDAIVTKGLDQALPVYAKPGAWTVNHPPHWNLVCNSAFGIGALAVAEVTRSVTANDVPRSVGGNDLTRSATGSDVARSVTANDDATDKSAAVLRGVLESVPHGMQLYGPEGAWPEGSANSEYAMRYACLLFSALGTAVGTDSGLSAARGFDRAGRFRVYTTGPANHTVNVAGGVDDNGATPELFWIARRFASPTLAWMEQKQAERSTHPDPLDLAWFERDGKVPQSPGWPLDAVFHSVQTASFRGSWEDPTAIFLLVKGGDNKTGRSVLDLGSFVLDAGGVRWAINPDPADVVPPAPSAPPPSSGRPQAAGPPQAQGPAPNPTSWVTRTESHNTLLIDNENQDARAEAAITHQEFAPDLSWVQIDLGKSNGTRLQQWTRRAGLLQRQAALVHDVVRSLQPVEVLWGMVTDADISLDGPAATLKKGAWNLALDIRTPRHAVFDTVLTGPSLKKLVVRLGDKTSDLDLSILMTPWKDGQSKPKITGQFPDIVPPPAPK